MRVSIVGVFGIAGVLGVLAGCEKSSAEPPASGTASAERLCDPVHPPPEPIAIGTVLAAGRAPDGTVWVIDQPGPRTAASPMNERLFKSDGNVLKRVRILGAGSGPDFMIESFDDGQVRVELSNGVVTRMGVKMGPDVADPQTKSFDISTGEELSLISADELKSFGVENLTDIAVLIDAKTPDGHRLFAFRPTIDYDDSKVRVFYGTDDRLIERRVNATDMSKSGSLALTFDLDGVETVARLNVGWALGGSSSLELRPAAGGDAVSLTPVEGSPGYGASTPAYEPDAAQPPAPVYKSADELTAGLTFVCF